MSHRLGRKDRPPVPQLPRLRHAEDLDVEIHLPKEGQIISKDSKSQAKLVHGIQLVIARNYIENLRDEVRKGMREKAAQGYIQAVRRSATATTNCCARLK